MTGMENEIVKSLNLFYYQNKIKALAHRLYQSQYSRGQWADILSDSSTSKYYFLLECKSINTSKYKTLNFKSRFSESNGVPQLEKEHFFMEQAGRKGFLCIECRMGAGKAKESFFLPLEEVYNKWKSGEKSLKLKEIMSYPKIGRKNGKYLVTDEIFV